ncbi:hypothetical protein KM043_004820 [Ampulex compressa]|nr:hypothetical protein KM043_004820 [Ampulex compressa]
MAETKTGQKGRILRGDLEAFAALYGIPILRRAEIRTDLCAVKRGIEREERLQSVYDPCLASLRFARGSGVSLRRGCVAKGSGSSPQSRRRLPRQDVTGHGPTHERSLITLSFASRQPEIAPSARPRPASDLDHPDASCPEERAKS